MILGTLLDRPHGLARHPVEDVHPPGLARLHHSLDPPSIDGDLPQARRTDGVVLPEIVVDHLEVPHSLTRRHVEDHEAVGEEVVTGAMTPIVRGRRSAERHVHVSELFVRTEAAPGTLVTRVPPGVVSPSVHAELTFLRHYMEGPEKLPAPHVVPPHILALDSPPLVARVAGSIKRAGDDHDIPNHDGARAVAVRLGRRPNEVHPPAIAEIGICAAGLRVEGVQISSLDQNQTPVDSVRPVVQPSGAPSGNLLQRRSKRLLEPNGLTARRIEGFDQAHAVRRIKNPVDEDRRRSQITPSARAVRNHEIGVRFCVRSIHGRALPQDLNVGDVVAIDLFERGVPGERFVTTEVGPIIQLGGAGFDAHQAHQQARGNPS